MGLVLFVKRLDPGPSVGTWKLATGGNLPLPAVEVIEISHPRISDEYQRFVVFFYNKVLKHMFLAASQSPGRFRKLREACRARFHLARYLSDFMVPSYVQKAETS